MEQKGDLLIHDLWHNGTESVDNMPVLKTYANSQSAKTPEKWLQKAERTKKKMYLKASLKQHQHLLPSITSVDGILGVEAAATLKRGEPDPLQQNGRNTTLIRVETTRVGFTSLWCMTHTGESGVPGCCHTRLACSAHSGRTAPVSTYLNRRSEKTPKPAQLLP